MVRNYRPRNRFCRHTKLSEEQFKQVMYRLFNLDRYSVIQQKTGVSENTTSRLALRLDSRIVDSSEFRERLFDKFYKEHPEICRRIASVDNTQAKQLGQSALFCRAKCPRSFQSAHLSPRERILRYHRQADIRYQSLAALDERDGREDVIVTQLCEGCDWAACVGVDRDAKDEIYAIVDRSIENHRLSAGAAEHHIWRFYISSCIAYRATRLLLRKYSLEDIEGGQIDHNRALKIAFNEFMNGFFNLLIIDPL